MSSSFTGNTESELRFSWVISSHAVVGEKVYSSARPLFEFFFVFWMLSGSADADCDCDGDCDDRAEWSRCVSSSAATAAWQQRTSPIAWRQEGNECQLLTHKYRHTCITYATLSPACVCVLATYACVCMRINWLVDSQRRLATGVETGVACSNHTSHWHIGRM